MSETSTVQPAESPAAAVPRSALGAVGAAPGWVRYALLLVGLAVALWLPNGLYPAIAVDILCWALFAVAIDLLLGFTGLMSFGHAAFWGTSAYATGLVAIHAGVPFPVAVLAGALVAAVLAVPIGYLAVKRTGIYFAMVTLAFAQMIYYIANKWGSVTGGENGLQSVPRELFGLDLSDEYYFYYAALPIVILGLAAAWRIVHSPFGRVLVGIRDNPARARALGYPVHRYKLTAFVLSAFLAGLGGGLFVMGHRFVSLDALHWTTSGKAVIVVVLGGIGTLWGGVLGAAILVRLEDWLSYSGFETIGLVTGGIFVLVVLLFRRGIWGSVAALAQRWRVRRR
ncbi:branched-chain amino acid ABC transporter permease [Micromonospora craterilacus]|uniref:Branched-chain amino acid ABC transporter permease n=1 Tax=Micromonospora craterilacus TaxID=1655439 RepID=A0A2W2D8S3_9ACTN|nr:branched-chain amino acid ABC transporter permease [Micromonospora craterilacus]PZG08432.1 branched-chain amino acid ABC transporter permease [Micromonospora craterilacus]